MLAFVLTSTAPLARLRYERRVRLERVLRFIDALAEMPASSWLDIGRSALADGDQWAARSTARPILDAIAAERKLDVAVWYVCDALDTAVFLARRRGTRCTRAERRLFDAAYEAAEDAALAILAQPYLSAAAFTALFAPFADRIDNGPHGTKAPAGRSDGRLREVNS